ncbi:MAG: hypothetical protein GX050_04245 [Firmicutes bacterium]|nr:hypothetical protein [Bacillota bacterium]
MLFLVVVLPCAEKIYWLDGERAKRLYEKTVNFGDDGKRRCSRDPVRKEKAQGSPVEALSLRMGG